jgi:hypothetical protein
MRLVSANHLLAASLAVLLTACGGPRYATDTSPAAQPGQPCPVGSTCDTLGGNVGAEHERLNSGLEADDPAALEAEAARIRGETPDQLEESIEKIEKSNK